VCLVIIAWQVHPDFPLIIAANRDEFHTRPAAAMHWWDDQPGVLAGRDLEAGGTWLAVSRNGRYAGVTNVRESGRTRADARSRGELVSGFVAGTLPVLDYARAVDDDSYRGFNMFAGDDSELLYMSNRGAPAALLAPGIYGISNALLDTPWPKLLRARERVRNILESGRAEPGALFDILADRTPAPEDELPGDLADASLARAASAAFIVHPDYGTRCSTALLRRSDGTMIVAERRFDRAGRPAGESSFRIGPEAGRSQARSGDGR